MTSVKRGMMFLFMLSRLLCESETSLTYGNANMKRKVIYYVNQHSKVQRSRKLGLWRMMNLLDDCCDELYC